MQKLSPVIVLGSRAIRAQSIRAAGLQLGRDRVHRLRESGGPDVGTRVEPDLPGEPVPAGHPAEHHPASGSRIAADGCWLATERRTRVCTTSVRPLRPGERVLADRVVDEHLGAVGQLVHDMGRR